MRTHIEIITSAIENNCSIIRHFSNQQVGIVAKSNAYGHGVNTLVPYLEKNKLCDILCVAYAHELNEVRQSGWTGKLLLFGYIDTEILQHVVDTNAACTIYSLESAQLVFDFSKKYKINISVHIELETGMNRLGIAYSEIEMLINVLSKNHYIHVAGIYTHCFDAAAYETDWVKKQHQVFNNTLTILKKKFPHATTHASPSGALDVENKFDITRCGSALYGLWKSPAHKKRFLEKYPEMHFKQIMRWKSNIAQIKLVERGEYVGYNKFFCADKPMKIATIPVGYADGYHRLLTGKSGVIICGKWAPLCGYVSMNMFCVDITHLESADNGDQVILAAPAEEYPEISLATLGNHINIPAIAFSTGIASYIPRILVEK